MPRALVATHQPLSGQSLQRWRSTELIVLSSVLVVFAALAWNVRGIYDDGYIYLHVVQQVLAGNGPVYNAGQRVEVTTGPLWLWLLVVVRLLVPIGLGSMATGGGIACALGGMFLACAGSKLLFRRLEPTSWLAPFGVLLPLAIFAWWTLVASGLELGLTMLWTGTCCWVLARSAVNSRGRLGRLGAIALGLGPLIRPELAAESGIFILGSLLLVEVSGWRASMRIVLWALLVPFMYELFRMGYYGLIVPNPALAKQAGRLLPDRGLRYLFNTLGIYWLAIPLVSLLLGGFVPMLRRCRQIADGGRIEVVVGALVLAGVIDVAYIVLIGGDYIQARLILPGLFAICAPVSLVPITRTHLMGLLLPLWVIGASIAIRPATGLAGFPYGIGAPSIATSPTSAARDWYSGPGLYYSDWKADPLARRMLAPPASGLPPSVLITNEIGAPAVAIGTSLFIEDELGLASSVTSHLDVTKAGLPGHEDQVPTPWLIAMTTTPGTPVLQFDTLQPAPNGLSPMPHYEGRALAMATAWARAALRCPGIRNLSAAASEPMGVGRFFDNLWGSFSRTSRRISPDPRTAYREFCGRGIPAEVVRAVGRGGPIEPDLSSRTPSAGVP